MPNYDPLAQRMIPCPDCKGRGKEIKGHTQEGLALTPVYGNIDCIPCLGDGVVSEPPEQWAERNARIAWEAVSRSPRVPCPDRDCLNCDLSDDECITARLLAAEKATEGE